MPSSRVARKRSMMARAANSSSNTQRQFASHISSLQAAVKSHLVRALTQQKEIVVTTYENGPTMTFTDGMTINRIVVDARNLCDAYSNDYNGKVINAVHWGPTIQYKHMVRLQGYLDWALESGTGLSKSVSISDVAENLAEANLNTVESFAGADARLFPPFIRTLLLLRF